VPQGNSTHTNSDINYSAQSLEDIYWVLKPPRIEIGAWPTIMELGPTGNGKSKTARSSRYITTPTTGHLAASRRGSSIISSNIIGPEVGIEEFRKTLIGISREFHGN
jgi:hypothetical protein